MRDQEQNPQHVPEQTSEEGPEKITEQIQNSRQNRVQSWKIDSKSLLLIGAFWLRNLVRNGWEIGSSCAKLSKNDVSVAFLEPLKSNQFRSRSSKNIENQVLEL